MPCRKVIFELMAFESNNEIILKGNTETILNNLSILDSDDYTFQLKNDKNNYLLHLLFDIDKQSYGVYANIRNY